MNMRVHMTISQALLAGIAIASSVFGQIDRGTIVGIITDSTGAVVPGAKIQIIQIATNSTIVLASNAQGLYTAPNLPFGTYRVLVQKDGFTSITREPLEVRPGVTIRADFTLQPGSVSQSVTVTGKPPLLDVSTTSNATGMQANLIENLPRIVSGTQRAITDYLQNFPGYTGGGSFTPRTNGGSTGDTEVFIDGGPGSEWGISRGSLAEVSPLIEQVAEVTVESNAFNAEYGGFGNWFTNVILKSGTNELHGSVFDHFGNDVLNARSFFQPKKTPFRQNEGGFTIGGPVVLPKIYKGRNRTFFFASLGLFFSRYGAGGGLATIPTPAELQGNFSQLGVPIYDPTTTRSDGRGSLVRDPFPGNQIPITRISHAAQLIDRYIPAPNFPGVNNNYINPAAPTWPYFNTYTPLIKVDHSLSDTEKLSVSYMSEIRHRLLWENLGAQSAGLGPQPKWGVPQTNPLDWITDQIANSWQVRVNLDSIIAPVLVNHVTLSADRYINLGPNGTDGQGWDQKLGITGIPADNGSFPAINFTGGNGLPVNFGRAYEEDWHETRYAVNEDLTWSRGNHTMKFGFEIIRNDENRFLKSGVAGSFTFSNLMTSQPDAVNASTLGSAFASFLLGAVSSASAYIPLDTGLRFRHYGIFAQDDWKPTPKLSISYGLRWDYSPPFYEVNNYMTSFEPDIPNPGAGGILGALAYAGTGPGKYGRPFQDSWRKGFGPRLGLAYQVNNKTIIRASSGIYYADNGNQVPFTSSGALGYNAYPTFNSVDGYTPVFYLNQQSFPQNYEKPPIIDPSFLNGQAITYIPRNGDRLPQIINWVFDIQREVASNLSLDIGYIGSRSTHLTLGSSASQINYVSATDLGYGFLLTQPANSPAAAAAGIKVPFSSFMNQLGANSVAQALKPYPQYTFVSSDVALLPEGNARYNSLQIRATKRFSQDFQGLAFFTWMKNMTNAIGGNTVYSNFAEGALQYPGYNPLIIDPGTPAATFSTSLSYQLPFGKGRTFLNSASRLTDVILGGWTLSAFLRYQSGAALQIRAINPFATTLGYSLAAPFEYANYTGAPVYSTYSGSFDPSKDTYLNPAAFANPAPFTFGNTARYLSWARGFWQKSESIEVGKTFSISERFKFEFSADLVNPFNIVRWADPSTLAGVPTFGTVTNIQGTPRTIQLNSRLRF